ncbi:MAG: PhoH family protein [Alphaproteobacteria bacterium]
MAFITFDKNELLPELFGEFNRHLNLIESKFSVSLTSRGNVLSILGKDEDISKVKLILKELYKDLKKGRHIGIDEVNAAIVMNNLTSSNIKSKEKIALDEYVIRTKKKNIVPSTNTQLEYIKLLFQKDIVFAEGPAGTGKTYIAVAAAVSAFLAKKVDRIILSRPAIEAGEKLGFLPGDLKEKVDPFLRPLYDALQDMLPSENFIRYMELGEIEIAPLAFMRGRTLNNAFIILDEAQNTTDAQMKMFLTRIGEGSRMVINGDISQVDLPTGAKSGLIDAIDTLKNIKEIGFIKFENKDIIRHSLTTKIINAYDNKRKKLKKNA